MLLRVARVEGVGSFLAFLGAGAFFSLTTFSIFSLTTFSLGGALASGGAVSFTTCCQKRSARARQPPPVPEPPNRQPAPTRMYAHMARREGVKGEM